MTSKNTEPLSDRPDTKIPVVDFGRFLDGNLKDREIIATALDKAFRDTGFVYLTNHGVPQEKVDKCFKWSARFFELPEEIKMLAPHPNGFAHHRGYSGIGREKVTQMLFNKDEISKARETEDVKESYESGNSMDEAQPNIWLPDDKLPGFRAFMEDFFKDCADLIHGLLSALSIALSLPESFNLSNTHSKSLFQLRLLHYPSIPTSVLTSGSRTRISAHSDFGTLTLLFQDDVGGLEIEDPNAKGVFRAVEPKKGTVVVNIGDLMERWSNGRWKSTIHRVGVPPRKENLEGDESERVDRNGGIARSRYSIPFFASANTDAVIDALPGTWGKGRPKVFEKCTAGEYVAMRMAALY